MTVVRKVLHGIVDENQMCEEAYHKRTRVEEKHEGRGSKKDEPKLGFRKRSIRVMKTRSDTIPGLGQPFVPYR